jgi:hypothetical protein
MTTELHSLTNAQIAARIREIHDRLAEIDAEHGKQMDEPTRREWRSLGMELQELQDRLAEGDYPR